MTSSYRVFTDKNYPYFVTWTIVDWLPIFAEPAYRQIILDSLAYLRTNNGRVIPIAQSNRPRLQAKKDVESIVVIA